MSLLTKTDLPAVPLTSGQRLAKGLKEAALAPIDLSRGTAGLSFGLAKSAAGVAGRMLTRGKVVSAEVQDAVAEVMDTLPEVVSDARKRKLPRGLKALAIVGLLGVCTVALRKLRSSAQPEPSPRALIVEPQPQPWA